ncbi:ankyrin repeat and protein kinase domain-containing protein 1, partial [Biomphalaria pfeifferi]
DSPLHRACEKKCLFQVRQLVEELKDLNPKNRLGQTPLHVSVNNDALEISKVYRCRFAGFTWENTFDDLLPKKECINSTGLIKAKAKHDLKDSFGNMPIHISSSCGAAACLDVLISAGSCINAVNFQNETPLYLAAKRDNLLIIKKNLKCKPLVDVTSLSGLSAKGVAQISGHKKAVELIQAYER